MFISFFGLKHYKIRSNYDLFHHVLYEYNQIYLQIMTISEVLPFDAGRSLA